VYSRPTRHTSQAAAYAQLFYKYILWLSSVFSIGAKPRSILMVQTTAKANEVKDIT